jgi:hypothetical protein
MQNTVLQIVKAVGTYSYHSALKGYVKHCCRMSTGSAVKCHWLEVEIVN